MADKAYIPQNPYESSNVDPKYTSTTYNIGNAYRTIIPEQFKNALKVHQYASLAPLGASVVLYTVPEG